MTTLYRPVLIESADLPMDRFPEGTVATHPDYWPVERCSCSRWESEGGDRYDPDMVGWTALVPIEVREERTWISSSLAGPMHVGFGAAFDAPHARLVTPWSPQQ